MRPFDCDTAGLFEGYGGLTMATRQVFGGDLGWYSEIEPAACRLLEHHHPGVPNLGDITQVDWSEVPRPRRLTGGYPCQPFSPAGRRKGEDDERHLWPYVADALGALRPSLFVGENVRGHLTLGFDQVIRDLDLLGYDVQWVVRRAADIGAPHGRGRLFILGRDRARHVRRSAESEFYGSPVVVPDLGDPATDPLLTVRMQPPNTWERRYDGAPPRVVKLNTDALSWREVGDGYSDGQGWYENDEVADWPVQHPLVWGVAYNRLAGKAVPPPASAPAAVLEGDMGVESFRGETS